MLPDRAPSAPSPPPADAGLDELLAFAGRKYELAFETVSAGGVSLQILQIANMREMLDALLAKTSLDGAVHSLPLWAKIWPASVVLGHMLRHLPPAGRSVLEIGAGCGLTGLVAAALGFERVLITDINQDALLFARINILKNKLSGRAEARFCDIREDALTERFSLILGSEILYLDHLYRPLVKFLKRRLAPKDSAPEPEALLASDYRRGAAPFFKRAEKEFQIVNKQIGPRESAPDAETGARPERHLLTLHRLTRR